MSKKVLIHSIVFSPDGVSTAYLYNDIAVKLKESGFVVTVLTTTPHYNVVNSEIIKQPLKRKAFGLFYESNFKGIKVKHVYQKKYKSTGLRLLGFINWHIISMILGLSEKNIRLILSPSPPLTIGFLNILIAKFKSAKVIYNVQEIYPDLLIKEGGLRSKFIITLLKWLERFVYNHSDAITTIDQVFYDTIVSRFKEKNKLHIIPNFVDTEIYHPLPKSKLNIDPFLFQETDALKLMYAGNIGHAQDWMTLIELANELKEESVEFFVVGEGAKRGFLEDEKKLKNLSKLHLIPYQPRDLMPSLIAFSDLQFIFMAPETEGHGFPSKTYTIMACAKPIMVCSGENTPIVNFLKGKNCACLITEKNLEKKVAEMAGIIRRTTKEELTQMGLNGYGYLSSNYSKEVITNRYVDLVDSLLQ
ncbi:MAG: glycosyltransferase family 4 protein [Bacteroidetes bacterium]|nr:glycosyltransferase family 4 protein [Bacteroidota bacterium]